MSQDVTNEKTWLNVRNWVRNIEGNAPQTVNKILIGNKCGPRLRASPLLRPLRSRYHPPGPAAAAAARAARPVARSASV
jgi:hypothetical protein